MPTPDCRVVTGPLWPRDAIASLATESVPATATAQTRSEDQRVALVMLILTAVFTLISSACVFAVALGYLQAIAMAIMTGLLAAWCSRFGDLGTALNARAPVVISPWLYHVTADATDGAVIVTLHYEQCGERREVIRRVFGLDDEVAALECAETFRQQEQEANLSFETLWQEVQAHVDATRHMADERAQQTRLMLERIASSTGVSIEHARAETD